MLHPPTPLQERPRSTEFAKHTLMVVVGASLSIVLLDLLETWGFISPLVESALRLTAVTLSMVGFVVFVQRSVHTPSVTATAGMIAVCMVLTFGLMFVDDIERLDDVPIIGHSSPWKHTVSKASIAGWTCGIFLLLYTLLRRLEVTVDELHTRACDQREANDQLQLTIGELKLAEQQILRQERLAALGELASGIAHDLNNALCPIVLHTNLLLNGKSESDEETIQLIADGATHAAEIVSQLQHLYRPEFDRPRCRDRIDLTIVAERAIRLSRTQWRDQAIKDGKVIQVHTRASEACFVQGDATELQQVITNLIFNAVDAIEDKGEISVVTSRKGEQISLEVIDTGSGMTQEQRERCFEPFFSSKSPSTGLGLSVCSGIVARHDGSIKVASSTVTGTTIQVLLPVATSKGGVPPLHHVPEALTAGRRVLYIDDDDAVREAIATLLRCGGFVVETAEDGLSGLERLNQENFDLVLTDFGMRGFSGSDVVHEIKRQKSELKVGVVSGWSQADVSSHFQPGELAPDFIIQKPVTLERFQKMLAEPAKSA